jgi:hypothetical protein
MLMLHDVTEMGRLTEHPYHVKTMIECQVYFELDSR